MGYLGVDLNDGMPMRVAILLQVHDLYENRAAGVQGTAGKSFVNPTRAPAGPISAMAGEPILYDTE